MKNVRMNPGDSLVFTLELTTMPDLADSGFLDRLAERAYELEGLSDMLIGLNPDGSVTASFVIEAGTSMEAAEDGLDRFMRAFVDARPLRIPAGMADQPAVAVPTVGVTPAVSLVPV